jgi:hypothetical protein
MLPPFRIALRSAVPSQRVRMARALADANPDRDARDVDSLSPLWHEEALTLSAAAWASDEFDLLALDDLIWHRLTRRGRCELQLVDDQLDPMDLADVAWQLATRFQRFERGTNPASGTPFFKQILEAHARLYNRRRPLLAADHDHALDTWRWLLRLEPCAGLSLQLSALFHDIERLGSEAERQDERSTGDRAAFERTHAAVGARMAASVLDSLRAPPTVIARTRALISRHADPIGSSEDDGGLDGDAALLASADALSFFSLSAPGFAHHFGDELLAHKVAHGLARLTAPARELLPRLKVSPDVRLLISQHDRPRPVVESTAPPLRVVAPSHVPPPDATPGIVVEPNAPPA